MKIDFREGAWGKIMKLARKTRNPPHEVLNKLLENIDENDASEVINEGSSEQYRKR